VDTEKCTVLLTAIDQGSLSGAAEVLGYTPSGVSRLVASLEADLGLPLDAVSVKATTEEGLGFTGTGEGIAAHAVALINEN